MKRRQFLHGVGTAGVLSFSASAQPEETRPVSRVTIQVVVNGVKQSIQVAVEETLAELIRNRLGLHGVKIACNQAACGACTVLLDERPVYSCHLLAIQADGHTVTTIEGLAKNGHLHPLQEEFIAHDGLQCGFCTPGMILSCAATLARKPDATRSEIAEGIAGNSCRCGAYLGILDAAEAARGRLKGGASQ